VISKPPRFTRKFLDRKLRSFYWKISGSREKFIMGITEPFWRASRMILSVQFVPLLKCARWDTQLLTRVRTIFNGIYSVSIGLHIGTKCRALPWSRA
jgi:hypothetical protein